MTSECERIAELLNETFEGRAYYGASVMQVLEDVTAEVAARRSEVSCNKIWDLVIHLTMELDYHRGLIEGTSGKWVRSETTWRSIPDTSEIAWNEAVDALVAANRKLVSLLKETSDDILDEKVPQLNGWTFYRALNGTLHHSIFHAGQILILKRR